MTISRKLWDAENCLGTAQFGLDYGITNVKGKVEFEEVLAIKEYAIKNDITIVDTAQNYGNSEEF